MKHYAKNTGKLEIGSGEKPREGYLHFDIRRLKETDIVGDAKKLPFAENEFDEVYSRFFLEHLPRAETRLALGEMFRVLKPRGKIELIVPNLAYFCGLFLGDDFQKKRWALNKIYGFENYPEDHHFFGYDFEILSEFLLEAGFLGVKDLTEKGSKNEQYLRVCAFKPAPFTAPAISAQRRSKRFGPKKKK